MKIHRIAMGIACALLLAGCLPVTSKTPVGTTAGLGADPALFGTWRGRSEDQQTNSYFHFLPAKDGSIAAILVTPKNKEDDGGWASFTIATATLNRNRYMNAVETSDDGEAADTAFKGATIPLRYVLGKNHMLTLYLLDEDKTKQAIQDGRIAGTVETGQSGDVKITADAAALDAFMATPDAAKLFKVFMVLRRVD